MPLFEGRMPPFEGKMTSFRGRIPSFEDSILPFEGRLIPSLKYVLLKYALLIHLLKGYLGENNN